jgi:hypothetical protein
MRMCAMILLGLAIGLCSGCGGDQDRSGYWYNPDRTLVQAIHDVRGCVEASRLRASLSEGGPQLPLNSAKDGADAAAYKAFSDCMHNRGYRRVREDSLGADVQTARVPAIGGVEPVAGKESSP